MHATALLSQWLGDHRVIGHQARQAALMKLVQALLLGNRLTLTQLGRHRPGTAYAKHHIKAADRLLGNRHLHAERDGIYRAIARTLLVGIKRPLILIDWSDADTRRDWLMIKAAVAVGGRALSVYEKVYPMNRYNSPKTHREFLLALKTMLPEGCEPIIITDAGFRGPWFKAVEDHGWDWVGRIRNKIKYYREESMRFTEPCSDGRGLTADWTGDERATWRPRFSSRAFRSYRAAERGRQSVRTRQREP